jgi:outer membrane protein insertion porin family
MLDLILPKPSKMLSSLRLLGIASTSAIFLGITSVSISVIPTQAIAQSASISSIEIEGNRRIATSTILTLASLAPGQTYTGGQINAAVQRLNNSGFFKSVDFDISGSRVKIVVDEKPTINRIAFEGNKKLKDDDLRALISSQPRQTFSAALAEKDAQELAAAYSTGGRISAQATPKIIERSDNRVDLVFQITEGRVTEIEKITFVGNREFSEKRLRSTLATKQAGIVRALITSDTFIEDRLELDKQNLRTFYLNRGYIDFEVLSTSAELTRDNDAFLLTFNVEEGQRFNYGEITMITTEDDIDIEEFQKLSKIRSGRNYDPRKLESLLQEIDVKLAQKGYNFVTASPRILRNDDTFEVDVEIDLSRGQRLFVERIDIEGNSTTLDRVIRRQFELAEGDAFNRREIQEAADRIRALGFFTDVSVETREGSSPDQAIIDVNVVEQATGNLGIGAGYNSSDGTVFTLNVEERNFLGRGQTLRFDVSTSSEDKNLAIAFEDPSFLDRDLLAGISFGFATSEPDYLPITTETMYFAPRVRFPLGENATLGITYRLEKEEILISTSLDDSVTPSVEVDDDASPLVIADVGDQVKSSLILAYNFDKTNSVIAPTAGFKFGVTQQFAGLGGDISFSKTTVNFKTYTTIFNDDIILSAEVDAGVIAGSDTRITDRFNLGGDELRGFADYGVGPRDTSYTGADSDGDPLGGKMFAVARLEASFPIGLPEEYGIYGGLFLDAGSVWGLDNTTSGTNTIDDSARIRAAIGFSIFWDTVLGPLRFNFARPLKKESYDVTESFRFSIDTRF